MNKLKLFAILLINRFQFVRQCNEYFKLLKQIKRNNFGIYVRNKDDFNFLSSFLPYLDNEIYKDNLLKNLDKSVANKINKILLKISLLVQNNLLSFSDIFDQDDIKSSKDFSLFLKKNTTISFPINTYYVSSSKKKYQIDLHGRDILDLGAFDGDSSIVLSNLYPKSKVYAFEPESQNLDKLLKNIKLYNKKDIVVPVHYGVADYEGTAVFSGTGAGANMSGDEGTIVPIITIDKYVYEHKLHPGLLKRDIEGMEYLSILGAEKTIRQFKPVLFISIYHTGRDFFEIKPLIDSWDLGYKFSIEKWHNGHPFADTLLVCY